MDAIKLIPAAAVLPGLASADTIEVVPPTPVLLGRMPLAESAQWLLRWACDSSGLQLIWDRHRSRAFQRIITFPNLVRLVSEALLHYKGSGRRAFEKNILNKRLDASVAATFGKLGRLPLSVSQAFLEEGTAALGQVVVPASVTMPGKSLRDLHLIVIDGKVVKRVQKRLKPLRGKSGGMIGGRALVALDGRTGLALAMEANLDGDYSENLLVPGLLERVRRRVDGPRLFIADRKFGNLVQAQEFAAHGDHFIARLHSSCKFTPDPDRPAVTSQDENGRTLIERWGMVGGKTNSRRRVLRQIELIRPGKETIVVITDLLDHERYPAADVMSAYRDRHGIEMVFQKTTEVFGLERLIGTSPRAGLFQFAFCLLLYNTVQTMLGYLAEVSKLPHERISAEKLFDDAQEQMIAWHVVFTPEQTEAYYRELETRPDFFMRHLRTILKNAWSPIWTKAKPQPNRNVPHKSHARTHASVQRLLDAASGKSQPDEPKPKARKS